MILQRQIAVVLATAIFTIVAAVSCNSSHEPEINPPVISPVAAPPISTAPTTERQSPTTTVSTTTHATTTRVFHDQRLRMVMAQISQQNPGWPAIRPQVAATNEAKQFANVSALAQALADSADQIPAAASSLPMSDADRASFLARGRTLHDQAVQLETAAKGQIVDEVQRAMDNINATCVSCHSRYFLKMRNSD
jgi:soluble cytochrome b562